MSVIGEISAIITVVELGLTFGNALLKFINEVKDAPRHMKSIAEQILFTTERLKEIYGLLENNGTTKTFTEEAVQSALRCSSSCETIIKEVEFLLIKCNWGRTERLELSGAVRWLFLKGKLQLPLAELQRIKSDLSLLYVAGMAIKS